MQSTLKRNICLKHPTIQPSYLLDLLAFRPDPTTPGTASQSLRAHSPLGSSPSESHMNDPTAWLIEDEDSSTLVATSIPPSPTATIAELTPITDLIKMSLPQARRFSALHQNILATRCSQRTCLTVAMVGDWAAAEEFVCKYQAYLEAKEVNMWIKVREVVSLLFRWLGYYRTPLVDGLVAEPDRDDVDDDDPPSAPANGPVQPM